MADINKIIQEEIMNTVANYPQFGDRLKSISEVGEGTSAAYPYQFDNTSFNEVHYYFSTEEDDYDVQINNVDMYAGIWDMQFGTIGGDVKDVINRGRMYKVMATILKIITNFLDNFKPNVLKFKPEKDEELQDDNRRLNLYMEYVKKNMRPDYFVYQYGEYIVVERKIKVKSNIPRL